MNRVLRACASIAGYLACSCTVTTDSGPPPPVSVVGNGILSLDWTVDGETDPDECDQSGAESIDVQIATDRGFSMGAFDEYCDAFVMNIELPPGGYYGDAVLLDFDDRTRTTPVDIGYFEIFGDDVLSISLDFPSDSFY